MRWSRGRRVVGVTISVGFALGAAQPVAAVDDDVPKRLPVLAWEVPVTCDTQEALAGSSSEGRHCLLAVAGDVVYIHEHTGVVGASGPYRLSAHEVATGAARWTMDVGETFEIRVTDEAVVLSDKRHIEVFDAETGTLRFTREGGLVEHNDYGVLVMDDGDDGITAVDAQSGDDLWTRPGRVGAMCRDFVAVIPTPSQPSAPFALVDHRSGRVRWESETDFDPTTHHIVCSGAPWLYVSDGSRIYEVDSLDGWITWETALPEAGRVDLYREVALVATGPGGAMVTAVRREDGSVLWEQPFTQVGSSLSWVGRLREDAGGLFTLHPLTGATVRRVDLAGTDGTPFDVVGVSDTRVVVAVDSTISAFGLNDLGMAWQLDVGRVPDDFGVTKGYLLVRSGDVLSGYAASSGGSG